MIAILLSLGLVVTSGVSLSTIIPIAIGLAFWSILTALSGAARGFVSMLIPRMLIGVGESMMTPTAMSLLSDRFPARQLGFASGFYYMGVPVGVAASLFVVAYLEPILGWRGCFYLLGGIGVFLALLIVVFLREPKRKQVGQNPNEEQKVSFTEIVTTLIAALKNSPALLMTIGGGVAFHFILGAATFEQLWYVQERGFEARKDDAEKAESKNPEVESTTPTIIGITSSTGTTLLN